jgi:hypothetical protein
VGSLSVNRRLRGRPVLLIEHDSATTRTPDDACYADDIDAASKSAIPVFQVEDGVEVAAARKHTAACDASHTSHAKRVTLQLAGVHVSSQALERHWRS